MTLAVSLDLPPFIGPPAKSFDLPAVPKENRLRSLFAAILLMLAFPGSLSADAGRQTTDPPSFWWACAQFLVAWAVVVAYVTYSFSRIGKDDSPSPRIVKSTAGRLTPPGPSTILFDSLGKRLKEDPHSPFVTLMLIFISFTMRFPLSMEMFHWSSHLYGRFPEYQDGNSILFFTSLIAVPLAHKYLAPFLTAFHEIGHQLFGGRDSHFEAESTQGEAIVYGAKAPLRSFFVAAGGALADLFLSALAISVLLISYEPSLYFYLTIATAVVVSLAAYSLVVNFCIILTNFLLPLFVPFFRKADVELDGSKARSDFIRMNSSEKPLAVVGLIGIVSLIASLPFIYSGLPMILTGFLVPFITPVVFIACILSVWAESTRIRLHPRVIDQDVSLNKKNELLHQELPPSAKSLDLPPVPIAPAPMQIPPLAAESGELDQAA